GPPVARRRPPLPRPAPAAVAPRRAAADGVGFEHRDVDVALAQVVGGAEARNAAADHDGRPRSAHGGTAAVSCSSTSRPSIGKSATSVVRAGRGGGKVPTYAPLHSAKPARRRTH